MTYYQIADRLDELDLLTLGVDADDVTIRGKVISYSDIDGDIVIMAKKKLWGKTQYNAINTFRQPKKGEWYISGAIPVAYKAQNDFNISYHIAELVLVKTITTTKQIEVRS